MRSVLALALLLGAAPAALAQTPLTGSPGVPTTNTPPLAGTAVAPGPAAGPGAGPSAGGGRAAAPAKGERAHRLPRPLAERFSEADTDHDGSLTLAEARAAKMGEVVRDFGLIDKAKKGTVTLDNIQAFRRDRNAARAAAEAR